MTPEEALDHVHRHGVVLVSARGPLPRMTELIAGGPISGSWWSHPEGKHIFRVLRSLETSPEILVCRVVGGKLCFIHRRLWPALVRLAADFPAAHLARVRQEHSDAGHHENRETAFPQWVPAEVLREAEKLDERQARALLGAWATKP